MKTLTESIIGRKGAIPNVYEITKKDITGDIKNFPLGVIIRMMEEQETQGNTPNVKVFQKNRLADVGEGGFMYYNTDDGKEFWLNIIENEDFSEFFKRYPKYKKYGL